MYSPDLSGLTLWAWGWHAWYQPCTASVLHMRSHILAQRTAWPPAKKSLHSYYLFHCCQLLTTVMVSLDYYGNGMHSLTSSKERRQKTLFDYLQIKKRPQSLGKWSERKTKQNLRIIFILPTWLRNSWIH